MSWLEISIAVSEVIALYLIFRVWKSEDYVIFKVLYSIIAVIPFLGPFMVLWSVNIPSRQHPLLQDRERYRTDVFDRWRHLLDERNPQARFRLTRQIHKTSAADEQRDG